MPDYIYLLENRLSPDQQNALRHLREVAREAGTILFLTGDAVRDLTAGHGVRELEVAVHGNALKLKPALERLGAAVWGEDEASRSLYLCFPGTVRVDLVSTYRAEYPKPGQTVYHFSSIQDDLRRRDFTVNAMAISLNEGSYGLLMDPLNGAADIEARTLRLVSNYGFYDDPSLMIRAVRYQARLGWEMDPKTHARYDNAKGEGVIEHISAQARSRELEQIGHESEALKVLRVLEDEGWMKVLFPAWTVAKADAEKLEALHDLAVELLLQGVHADMSAAQMQLLTAKLAPKDLAALKKQMLRPGLVEEWNSLDKMAADFSKVLLAKENQIPSAAYRLFTGYDPEAVLWLGFTSADKAVRERYQLFLKTWPEVRQRIPYALLIEMRITADLANYQQILHGLFLELIDGRLTTPEELRAYLEPFSPPAPPPQTTVKRSRAKREAKVKDEEFDDAEGDDLGDEEMEIEVDLGKDDLLDDDSGSDGDDDEEEAPVKPAKGKAEKVAVMPSKAEKSAAKPAKEAKPVAAKPEAPAKPEVPAKPAAKPVVVKPAPKVEAKPAAKPVREQKPAPKVVASKAVPAKAAQPVKAADKPAAAPAKAAAKAAPAKPAAKPAPAKVVAKAAPVKAAPAKAAPAKTAPAKAAHGKAAPPKPAAKAHKPEPKAAAKHDAKHGHKHDAKHGKKKH